MSTIKVGNEYEVNLLKVVGHGEFGDIYLGSHVKSNKTIAAKKLASRDNMDCGVEIKMHTRISHKNIVNMLDFAYMNDCVWIFYELSSVGDLNTYFKHNTRGLQTIIHITEQLVQVVAFLHKQVPPIFHRSIKPSYIIPFDDSDKPLVKISGFARAIRYEGPIHTPELKPDEYKAPECHRAEGEWHILSDIFSIGMVMLAMIQHKHTSQGLYPLSVESIEDGAKDMPIGMEMMKAMKRGTPQPTVVLSQQDSGKEKTFKQLIKDMTTPEPGKRKTAAQCLPTFDSLAETQPKPAPEGHEQK